MSQIEHPTIIDSVSLRVRDVDRVTAFYEQVIGLSVRSTQDSVVELGTEKQTLIKLLHTPDGQRIKQAPGLYHLALRVPERTDLGAWLKHYIAVNNPNFQGASDHLVSEALYLSDPEGNGIEVYWDKPTKVWPMRDGGRVHMAVDPLDLGDLLAEAPDNAWGGLPANTDMGHVHLQVSNLQAAYDFYVEQLGLGLMTAYGDSALFVSVEGYHHHFGLNTWHSLGAAPVDERVLGLDHVDVRANAERFAAYQSLGEKHDILEALEEGMSFALRDPSYIQLVFHREA